MAEKKPEYSKFKMLSDIDQVLLRPEMWTGTKQIKTKEFLLLNTETGKLQPREVEYIPAILKIIDEIISNSVDEFRRGTSKLNNIKVSVNSNGNICVVDNGGIPVVLHPEYNLYVPEIVFGHLRASSNYDDTENRTWVGTNGVGSTLTNIFSKSFKVTTGHKGNLFVKSWRNNMHESDAAVISTTGKNKFKGTAVEFSIDFNQFEIDCLSNDFIDIIEKRCIDAAATNHGLTVIFERCIDKNTAIKEYKFTDFKEYVTKLFTLDSVFIIGESNKDWEYYIIPQEDAPYNIGFVNGAECNKGTHFSHIQKKVYEIMEVYLKKQFKLKDIPKKEVYSRINVFINVNVKNPVYQGQTKEELETKIDNYYPDKHTPSFGREDVLSGYLKSSELPDLIMDWNLKRLSADESKKIRQANKDAKKLRIDKLLEANSKDRSECDLWLFEGDSAASGFRVCRNPMTQASYKLRGKVMNTLGMKAGKILENQEYKDIYTLSGLRFDDPDNIENLRYNRFIICTDMDVDGTAIAAMLFSFFAIHFPGLVKAGRVCRAISPLLIASRGKDVRHYYTMEGFNKDQAKLNGYDIRYIKGLAGLLDVDYKQMLTTPHLQRLLPDDKCMETIIDWFGKETAGRKKILSTLMSVE